MIWEKRLLSFPQTHTFDFYMKTTFHFQSMCKWFWLGWSLNQHNFEHSLVVNVLSNLRMISFRKVLILGSFLHLCSLLLNIEQRQILFQSSFLHLSHCWDLQVTWLISCRFNLSYFRFIRFFSIVPQAQRAQTGSCTDCELFVSALRRVQDERDQPKMSKGQFYVTALLRGEKLGWYFQWSVDIFNSSDRHQVEGKTPGGGENHGPNVNPSSCASNTNTQSNIVVRFRL